MVTPASPARPGPCRLLVEGKVDLAFLKELLHHAGVNPARPTPPRVEIVTPASADPPGEEDAGGITRLFENLEDEATHLRLGGATGYIADADTDPAGRWAGIRQQMKRIGLELPTDLSDGFLVQAPAGGWIGGWVMPDNRSGGVLEDLLLRLVAAPESLHEHAKAATEAAYEVHGHDADTRPQGLRAVDRAKAELQCCLAWHRKPSLNIGTHFRRGNLDAAGPEAKPFLGWVSALLERAVGGGPPAA